MEKTIDESLKAPELEKQGMAAVSGRTAMAIGKIEVGRNAFSRIQSKTVKKGDVETTARIVGMLGAKQTADLFPYCYPNTLSDIQIDFEMDEQDYSINIQAFTKTPGSTSVEMEAMTAVSMACLAVFDMCKSLNPSTRITNMHLLSKSGGKGGGFRSN